MLLHKTIYTKCAKLVDEKLIDCFVV